MIIKKSAYNELINCKKVPPELGGILIGNAFVIDTVIFDIEKNNLNYTPNVDYLNSLIENNEIKGKHFWGMFHTHAEQWGEFSGEDIKYINVIMRAMPVKYLYFPLVFPEKKIVKSFKAVKKKDQIIIVLEKSIII